MMFDTGKEKEVDAAGQNEINTELEREALMTIKSQAEILADTPPAPPPRFSFMKYLSSKNKVSPNEADTQQIEENVADDTELPSYSEATTTTSLVTLVDGATQTSTD